MAKKEINIGMIGSGFMGKAHSFGYVNCRPIWDPKCKPVLKCVAARREEPLKALAGQFGWQDEGEPMRAAAGS